MRRAVRYAAEKLMLPSGSLGLLSEKVCDLYQSYFSNIIDSREIIREVINEEESQFLITLVKGEKLLKKYLEKNTSIAKIDGNFAWKLYDTFGFPLDLVQLISEEKGVKEIDIEEYEIAKQRSIDASKRIADIDENSELKQVLNLSPQELEQLSKNIPRTDDTFKYDYLYNDQEEIYITTTIQASILAIKTSSGLVDNIKGLDEYCSIILDRTNFYAERGGQLYDVGFVCAEGLPNSLYINNCQNQSGYILHSIKLPKENKLSVNDKITLEIDNKRRTRLMLNHTATHILNFFLR